MNTPRNMTLTEYRQAMEQFNQTLQEDPDGLRHVPCGTMIRTKTVYVSVHNSPFPDSPCAGSGQCVVVEIPYCPVCESEPDERGCLHSLPQPLLSTEEQRALIANL